MSNSASAVMVSSLGVRITLLVATPAVPLATPPASIRLTGVELARMRGRSSAPVMLNTAATCAVALAVPLPSFTRIRKLSETVSVGLSASVASRLLSRL